ncbi:MAG: alpha/beta fold hydrolase [Actinomycetota bacterium]
MPLLSIAGGTLFAERIGSGPPRILALHGWGRRGSDFSAALDGLDALCVDLPGFGASPEPPEAMGSHGYARLLAPALDIFEQAPVAVGHSFGGRVAVALEHDRPGSLAGLVLAGVPLLRRLGHRRKPPLAYRVARAAHGVGLLGEEAMERRRRRHGSADYRAATGVMRDVLVRAVNESYEEELEGLKPPVHLLWGADDREVPVSVAQEACRLIGAGGGWVELEILDGVGHHVPLQAPEATRRAVERMLERAGG